MPSDIEFTAPKGIPTVDDVNAADESRMYYAAAPRRPNSLFFPIGSKGHISWQSTSETPVLALLMLTATLLTMIVLSIIAALSGGGAWLQTALSALAQAVLAVIGAVIGSAARSGGKG